MKPAPMHARDQHAALRLQERYGVEMTAEVLGEILTNISAARRAGGRHPMACLISTQDDYRERWLVSVAGTVVQLVVATVIVTALPNDAGPRPAANQP